MPPSRKCLSPGFTLVELILVMVLAGALAALGAAPFFDRAGYDAAAYADQLGALVRYGQKVAIAQNRPVFVRLDGGSVALCFAGTACGDADRVRPASAASAGAACGGAPWACEVNPAGISYAARDSAGGAVAAFYFDALGRPCAQGDAFGAGQSTFQTLTLSVAGGGARAIVIEQETGYVH